VDVVLYGLSLGFAVVVAVTSQFVTHNLWARVAALAYGGATAASLALLLTSRSVTLALLMRARLWVLGTACIGCVALPLLLAVALRAEGGPAFTHDEVLTTERAGVSVLRGDSPYDHTGTPADAEARRFPYLPLMAAFGVPRALAPDSVLADARLWFLLGSLGIGVAAITTWSAPDAAKIRAAQLAIALPTAAMGAVAGGHDLVVLSTMMLALVLVQRGRATSAAVAASCAGLMKATAWPLWIALLARWIVSGRRAPGTAQCLGGLALLPIGLLAALAWDSAGLVGDTVMFPLGLADRETSRQAPTWQQIALPQTWWGELEGLSIRTAGTVALIAVTAMVWRRSAPRCHSPEGQEVGIWTAPTVALIAAALSAGALLAAGPLVRPGLMQYPLELVAFGILLARHLEDHAHGQEPRGARDVRPG
jgi:hypothetical protein